MKLVASIVLLALAAPVFADDTAMSGFATRGNGELTGRVTDDSGSPLRGVKVHAVSNAGELTAITDKDGRYTIELRNNTYALVYVERQAHVSGQLAGGTEEIVEIHETIPPAVMPKPKGAVNAIPEYSDKARDDDVWLRAWLILEVSERGVVDRVKLVNAPGHDLDAIAIREAFKLTFEPARDRAKQPIRAMMVWTFEWPSYWWMLGENHRLNRVPDEAAKVRCRTTGPASSRYRDCSKPNLARAVTQAWLERR